MVVGLKKVAGADDSQGLKKNEIPKAASGSPFFVFTTKRLYNFGKNR